MPTAPWVLSDRQLEPGARTFAVPQSPAYRATRPATGSTLTAFEPIIQTHAAKQGLSPDLVRAVIQVESAFNPRARSPKGAMGLMQLMPGTAAQLGVTKPYDIAGGTAYLRGLLDRFGGNVELALAAYNAGPAAVDRFGLQVPPFRETQNYVDKVGRVTGTEPGPAAAPRAGKSSVKATRAPAPKALIYRVVDLVDGRPVARYTTERPTTGAYEVFGP